MRDLVFSVNIVLPLFLMMILGYIFTKMKIWDAVFLAKANKICFKIFFPVLLFNNMYQINIKELVNGRLILFAVVGIIVVIVLSIPLATMLVKEYDKRGVIIQSIFRSNFILFGISIADNIFGSQGVGVTAMLIAFVIPLFNISAVIILAFFSRENKSDIGKMLKDIVTNPLIIGCVLGIIAANFNIIFPKAIDKTLSDLGSVGTPLALLVLGGDFKFSGLKKNMKYINIAVIGKLIIVPMSALSTAVFLGFRGYELVAVMALFASPVAINSYNMAHQAGADSELAGQLVVLSTLLSPITLFLFVYCFKIFKLI